MYIGTGCRCCIWYVFPSRTTDFYLRSAFSTKNYTTLQQTTPYYQNHTTPHYNAPHHTSTATTTTATPQQHHSTVNNTPINCAFFFSLKPMFSLFNIKLVTNPIDKGSSWSFNTHPTPPTSNKMRVYRQTATSSILDSQPSLKVVSIKMLKRRQS